MAFSYRHRVQFFETDGAQIVHFSNYFRFMEMAETALYETFLEKEKGRDGSHGFPRVNVQCHYKAPLRFRDEVEICVSLKEIRSKSFTLRFDLFKVSETQKEPVAEGEMSMVYVTFDFANRKMTPGALPEAFRVKLMQI